MRAAVYARKSTEQTGVADHQRSVTRQIESAKAYAARKGWAVAAEHVYVDDGISGAEFANRSGLPAVDERAEAARLFRRANHVGGIRLGREAIETAYTLKQLVQAGVRVFFYLEDRERTLDSPTEKFMLSLTAFTDEIEREKARQRTYEAMARKARNGHVTGGRCFGYDNVEVKDATGKRSHVVRQINEEQAATVRKIFRLRADGNGFTAIAKRLNADYAPSPRAQRDRPHGWTSSSVREVLHRGTYKGEVTWNRTRKRDQWGRKRQTARNPAELVAVPVPELAIVSEEEWAAAHAAMASDRARFARSGAGRPPGSGAKYLLTGLLKCRCGAGIEARTRQQGRQRVLHYGCSAYQRKGRTVCDNAVAGSR